MGARPVAGVLTLLDDLSWDTFGATTGGAFWKQVSGTGAWTVRRGANVHDQFDVTLEDGDLLGEVELTTTLIIAASEADEHLTQAEIDHLLGVGPHRD